MGYTTQRRRHDLPIQQGTPRPFGRGFRVPLRKRGQMPQSRCLSCGGLIDSRRSRHPWCAKEVKDERNRQAAALGPCPQVGLCPYCLEPAKPRDPFVWCHHPKRFIDGGKTVIPGHKSCNEGTAKKH